MAWPTRHASSAGVLVPSVETRRRGFAGCARKNGGADGFGSFPNGLASRSVHTDDGRGVGRVDVDARRGL